MSDAPNTQPSESVNRTGSRPGPKTPEGKARALANLQPPWPKGVSGNPGGSRSFGPHVAEWINNLADSTQEQLEAIADDPDEPVARRAACPYRELRPTASTTAYADWHGRAWPVE